MPCDNGTYLYRVQPGDSLWLIAKKFNTTINDIVSLNDLMDLNRIYVGQILCVRPNLVTNSNQTISSQTVSMQQFELSNHLRMLWEQHVYWTRFFIISTAFDLPDSEYVTNRLLRNPKDFAAALTPLYDTDVADKFENLFTAHLTIAAELVKAAKEGNQKAAEDAEQRWYENANQIAAFLSSINPYWSEKEWKQMLDEHLAMTKDEAVYLLTEKFEESINEFDKIEIQALQMADVMTDGIAKQFPEYFR